MGAHPWSTSPSSTPLAERIAPPEGFRRLELDAKHFGTWLRSLPLKSGRPEVRLFDGRRKSNQNAHYAVMDLDVGSKDLQQCADAIIRLRAEFLYSQSLEDRICFRFTSGHPARLLDWQRGLRPDVQGREVHFLKRAKEGAGYGSFRSYLETVFMYAGSLSLSREMVPVPGSSPVEPGDVLIRGGSPGHAVIVLDVAVAVAVAADDSAAHRGGRSARAQAGRRVFLLGQSFMPAQEMHVLIQPGADTPWYGDPGSGPIETPEWSFTRSDLRRFVDVGCPERRRLRSTAETRRNRSMTRDTTTDTDGGHTSTDETMRSPAEGANRSPEPRSPGL